MKGSEIMHINSKRLLSLFLVLMMILSVFPLQVFGAVTTYTDVKESDYFYTNVEFATEKGIINGIGNNQFNPQGILTVAQAIKISACINVNFYEKDIEIDDSSNHWADCYYTYAVENGIIKETDFNKADFDKAITRDKLFYIFANTLPDSEYIQINEKDLAPEKDMADYIEKLFCAGIVVGNENGFELEENITRADTTILISRMCAYSRRQIVLESVSE